MDPGSAADHPAWPLRNALLAAAVVVRLRRLRVVCVRVRGAAVSTSASLLLDVALPEVPPGVALPPTVLHTLIRVLMPCTLIITDVCT